MKHIVRSAFFITLGGALPLMAGVLLLIPYTDNLSTAHYGALAIYISFALLVQILMNYGVDSYLSVHYYDHNEDPVALRRFLSQVTGSLMAYGLALSAILTLLGWILFPLLFPDGNIRFWPYGFMSIATGFFNAWFRMYVNIQVFADRARKYFYFGLFNFIVTVIISTVLVYAYPGTLIGPMWGRLLSGVLIFALSLGYGLREFGIRIQFDLAKEIRKYSTPIVIFSLLTWVLSYINNYILNALATPADVGVYDFALKCTLVIEYAGLGLMGTINPRIYQLWKKNGNTESTQEENRYYHAYSAVNILLIAANILVLPFIIRLFIRNAEYHESIDLLPILCVSFVFKGLYGMFVNPVFYFKKTDILPRTMLFSAFVQIAAGIFMIQYFGIAGAVWSFFLVRPLQIIVLWLSARKIYTFRFNYFKMITIPVIYASAVFVLYELLDLPATVNDITQALIAAVLIFSVYWKEVSELPKVLLKKG